MAWPVPASRWVYFFQQPGSAAVWGELFWQADRGGITTSLVAVINGQMQQCAAGNAMHLPSLVYHCADGSRGVLCVCVMDPGGAR